MEERTVARKTMSLNHAPFSYKRFVYVQVISIGLIGIHVDVSEILSGLRLYKVERDHHISLKRGLHPTGPGRRLIYG